MSVCGEESATWFVRPTAGAATSGAVGAPWSPFLPLVTVSSSVRVARLACGLLADGIALAIALAMDEPGAERWGTRVGPRTAGVGPCVRRPRSRTASSIQDILVASG